MANTNRNKGHNAEREYCKMFSDLGYKYCVTSRYGSRQHDDCGIDLINVPYNVQIKAGYARGLNYTKVLRDISERIELAFPKHAPEHNQPTIIIHKKDVGKGIYEGEWFEGHEAVQTENAEFISWSDFRKMMMEDLGYQEVSITNVIELTSKDYGTWIS